MTTFLGLDVGTQGLKLALLDPEHGVVATGAQPLDLIPDLPPGHSEQNPTDWIDAVRAGCADLRARAPAALGAVKAVAVSGQQHGLVALDEAHRVVRPAMLWNDVRCARECDEIVAAVGGPDRAFTLAGLAQLPPGFTAGKLRWCWRHEPDRFARIRHLLLPHDYVDLWLGGTLAMEAGDASGTGLFDVRGRRFAPQLCDATAPGVADLLPTLVAPGALLGALRPEIADELGLPRRAQLAHGGGDNMMAAVGAGALEPGIAVMSLGTSGTVFAHADRPVCDPAGEIAPFCGSTGAWLPLGCTMNATVATEAARALFGYSIQEFEAAVSSAPAGAGGVLCLPFLTGERSPNLPDATGALLGLTPRNLTAPNLARAAMEGATFGLCRLLDRLRALGVEVAELRLTGGGSNSATWCQVVAATSGLPVRTGVSADAAALGAAILAAWCWRRAQGETDLDAATCRREFALDGDLAEVGPSAAATEIYRDRRATWQAAVDALTPAFPRIRP